MITMRLEKNSVTEKVWQRVCEHAHAAMGILNANDQIDGQSCHFQVAGKKLKITRGDEHLIFELFQAIGNEELGQLTEKMGFRFNDYPSEQPGIIDLDSQLVVMSTSYEMTYCSRFGTFDKAYRDRAEAMQYLRMLVEQAVNVYQLDAASPENGAVAEFKKLVEHLYDGDTAAKVMELVEENVQLEELKRVNLTTIHKFLDHWKK